MKDYSHYEGRDLLDENGDKVGQIGSLYLDDDTENPKWLTVNTGLFGSRMSFVPLEQAKEVESGIQVPFQKDFIKDAPNVDADEELGVEDEDKLYSYYHMSEGAESVSDENAESVGLDTSGPETDNAMTRSEEELHVGKEVQAVGKVRLRKYIVTENVTTTVPLQREEVRLEREPITDANRDQAMSGADLSDEEHELTLHAEQPVVDKQVVAKERVRLATDIVNDEHQVSEDVRKEKIEMDEPQS